MSMETFFWCDKPSNNSKTRYSFQEIYKSSFIQHKDQVAKSEQDLPANSVKGELQKNEEPTESSVENNKSAVASTEVEENTTEATKTEPVEPLETNKDRKITSSARQPKKAVPKAVQKAKMRGEPVEFVNGQWICMDCGYVYPDDSSVSFESLPNNWKCPVCGAPKKRFYKKQGDKIVEKKSDDSLRILITVSLSLGLIAFGYWATHNL